MDILGLFVLLALATLFGWLVTWAWRARRPWVKWPGVVFSALVTLIFTLSFVLALIGGLRLTQNYNASHPVSDVKVARTNENVARGEKLANICVGCHGEGKFPLKGSNFAANFPFPLGTLWAANLTPAGEIKDWTDGEIIRAIREGIHKDGRSLLIMPSEAFHQMSDEDAQALVAFLRSQQPAGEPNPPTKLNALGSVLVATMFSGAFSVQPHLAETIKNTPSGVTAERGAYMASISGCHECHGQNLEGDVNPESGAPVPSLSTIGTTWTEKDFLAFFRTGIAPNGRMTSETMPWQEINKLANDDDLKALFLYVKSAQTSSQ